MPRGNHERRFAGPERLEVPRDRFFSQFYAIGPNLPGVGLLSDPRSPRQWLHVGFDALNVEVFLDCDLH